MHSHREDRIASATADGSGDIEFILLTVMSYDHNVAICKPLHYLDVMNNSLCWSGHILLVI
ncbi:hypothetical protein AB205_0160370 [Aquarana catesbeiana]|uniref:G-protein coupled receptors family 1 profile domain-containing protein n=1 Tax=Aquarana catesbeiana TaxID=8400 RepID=A0A2G9QM37_AQUCT|nr:hypothetical protein AB205_0160370 [Aquarana catesbeiana]